MMLATMNQTLRIVRHDAGLAFRFAVLILAFVLGVISLIACAAIANAATLKTDAVLQGSVLTAGDLFDGLDKDIAAKVLGPAPQPGQDLTLNTITLMQVAAALNIDWKPQSTSEQITVRSASIIVDQQTVTDALTQKLKDKGVNGNFSLSFYDQPKLILPKDAPPTAEVASITYHPESDRFEATIAGPTAAKPTASIQISGHVEHTMSIPELKKAMRTGDIVHADDVTWVELPVHGVEESDIIDADKLIGKTPRRMVLANQPIHDADVTEPMLVSRGETVTITYEKGAITVTAKGRAMEDGAKGSLIKVTNVASSKSIDATVTDDGLVTVQD